MYSIQRRWNSEWVDVGLYPDTEQTAIRHARLYALDEGCARVLNRDTDEVVGVWERVGDRFLEDPTGQGPAHLIKGKARKVMPQDPRLPFRYPNNAQEKQALLDEFSPVVNRHKKRTGWGTFDWIFTCPSGHDHRDMMVAVMCEARRVWTEGRAAAK